MQELFLLQNQDKLFLSKQNGWVDGRDLNSIYKTEHKDEALNQLFEINTKDYGQRIHIISCPTNEKRLPKIDPDILPPPIPKAPKELTDNNSPQLELAATDIISSADPITDEQSKLLTDSDSDINIDSNIRNSENPKEIIIPEVAEEKN